jgi:hypothetical protein
MSSSTRSIGGQGESEILLEIACKEGLTFRKKIEKILARLSRLPRNVEGCFCYTMRSIEFLGGFQRSSFLDDFFDLVARISVFPARNETACHGVRCPFFKGRRDIELPLPT